jgi:DegV family protein with EDD domain
VCSSDLDTLEYLQRGGRIGRVQGFLGSVLKVKPLITLEDGETRPLERPRTLVRAQERLVARVLGMAPVLRLGVIHSTVPDIAEVLAKQLAGLVPRSKLVCGRFGPVLGVHVGPGAFGVAVTTAARPAGPG